MVDDLLEFLKEEAGIAYAESGCEQELDSNQEDWEEKWLLAKVAHIFVGD